MVREIGWCGDGVEKEGGCGWRGVGEVEGGMVRLFESEESMALICHAFLG